MRLAEFLWETPESKKLGGEEWDVLNLCLMYQDPDDAQVTGESCISERKEKDRKSGILGGGRQRVLYE